MNYNPNLVQAANILGSMKEKVVEGMESAAEKVTLMAFSMILMVIMMVIMMTPSQEVTWLGLGSSGKGELDKSQVLN